MPKRIAKPEQQQQSRVFVTQQPKPNGRGWTPNLTPAAKFGALHYVFQSADRPGTDTEWAMDTADDKLDDFNPLKDYVVWPQTGDPAAAWAVMLTLANRGLTQVQVLNWEREFSNGQRHPVEGFYTVITFRLL